MVSNSNRLDGRVGRCDMDLEFKHPVGVLWVDSESCQDRIVVAYPRFHVDPFNPEDDLPLADSLYEIRRRWPERRLALYLWAPDPRRWPKATQAALDLGIKDTMVSQELSELLSQAGWE